MEWQGAYKRLFRGCGLNTDAQEYLVEHSLVSPAGPDMAVSPPGVDPGYIAKNVRDKGTILPTVQPYRSIWHPRLHECPKAGENELIGFEAGGRAIFWHKGTPYLIPAGVLFGGGRDINGEISLAVMSQAMLLAGNLNKDRPKKLSLSANLSLELLLRGSFHSDLKRIMNERSFNSDCLVLELLENIDLAREDAKVVQTLRKIVAMGIKLAIDDLGIDHSFTNLEFLLGAGIAVSEVKFDGCFSEQMDNHDFWKVIDDCLKLAEKAQAKRVVWEGLANGLSADRIVDIRTYHSSSKLGVLWRDRALFEGRVV